LLIEVKFCFFVEIWSPKLVQNMYKPMIGAAEKDLTVIDGLKRCVEEKLGWDPGMNGHISSMKNFATE
jgi:hypothetical protein